MCQCTCMYVCLICVHACLMCDVERECTDTSVRVEGNNQIQDEFSVKFTLADSPVSKIIKLRVKIARAISNIWRREHEQEIALKTTSSKRAKLGNFQLKNCTQDTEVLMEMCWEQIDLTLLKLWDDSAGPKYRRRKKTIPAAKEQKLTNQQLKNCTQDAEILMEMCLRYNDLMLLQF